VRRSHRRAVHWKNRPATGCKSLWWATDPSLTWQEQEQRVDRILLTALEARAFSKFGLWQPKPTVEERWSSVLAELTRRGEVEVVKQMRKAIWELTHPGPPVAGTPFNRRASRNRGKLTYVANQVGVNPNTLKSWLRRLEHVATHVVLGNES
jgi:hypothetical protein